MQMCHGEMRLEADPAAAAASHARGATSGGGSAMAAGQGGGTTAAKRRALLGRHPLFAEFAGAELDLLTSHAVERPMRAGETLVQTGDPGVSMMAIISGQVQVLLAGAHGRDQVIGLLGPGAVFGELSLFDGKPRSACVAALTKGRLLVIEREPVRRLLESDPRFAARVIEIMCLRLRSTITQLDAMLFQDIATRLANSLPALARGGPPRRIDITQTALGQIVGASREMVNKRLKALEAIGAVSLSQGRIVLLDETRLAEATPRRRRPAPGPFRS